VIDPTTGVTSPANLLATTTAPSNAIGKDEFLQLLVTQLRNQDPMSPLQPHEFAAQLAQFTSVEQLTQLNDAIGIQTQALNMVTLMNKTTLGASLIVREITAGGNHVVVPSSGQASVRIDVGGSGGNATLKVLDSSGHVVATRALGPLKSGRQDVDLPSDVPPGTYTYSVDVVDASGGKVPVTTFTRGVVDAVQFDSNGIVLRIGSIEVSLESLDEIEPSH
jgi:flagellar basal-body rod modification protein FlgD